MPLSKGRQIRDAVMAEVAKVVGLGDRGPDWTLWDRIQVFPAAFTILDSDRSERGPTTSKTVTAFFRIACVLQSATPQDDFDALRAAIEAEIEDDPSLGQLAEDAFVSGVSPFATAPEISAQTYVRNIYVDVIYRHARAAA